MSLFIDGSPSTVEDLTDQDSGLLDVCRVQHIDVATKLRLDHGEIAVELESVFEQQRSVHTPYWGHPRFHIGHVAITPILKMWHVWHTLSLVYRDAYFDQLNDRFKAKWEEYRRMGESAKNGLRNVGIGFVLDPLPRPNVPILNPTPAAESGGTFYFAVALQNSAGEQSAPSTLETVTVPAGNAVEVQIAAPPANARGWNVYVGSSPGACYRQNDGSISLGDVWSFYPSTAVLSGSLPGRGQDPTFLRPMPRLLPRG
jgi:hypothetical protein